MKKSIKNRIEAIVILLLFLGFILSPFIFNDQPWWQKIQNTSPIGHLIDQANKKTKLHVAG